MKPIILLDAGHGIDTPGKCSPKWSNGKQLFEYEFNRDIVHRISKQLQELSIPFHIVVPEKLDIALDKRNRRINAICKKEKCILISVHANAGGGKGFEVYTTKGQNNSDKFAEILVQEFKKEFPNESIRVDLSDGDLDKESNFQIIKYSNCIAVLSECFFMDNEKDCKILLSEVGRAKIANFHTNAIIRFINGTN